MEEPISVRDYSDPADRTVLRQFIVELQEHERTVDPHMPPGESMADDYLEMLLENCRRWNGRILFGTVQGTPAGFVCVLTQVPPGAPDEPRALHAYVSDLFVAERFRETGLGSALLRETEMLARASGAALLRIAVLADNEAPLRLYRKLGFKDYQIQLSKRRRRQPDADARRRRGVILAPSRADLVRHHNEGSVHGIRAARCLIAPCC